MIAQIEKVEVEPYLVIFGGSYHQRYCHHQIDQISKI